MVLLSSMTLPDSTRHCVLGTWCKTSVGRCWLLWQAVRDWHLAICICFLAWRRDCQCIVSPAIKALNVLLSSGRRIRDMRSLRPGLSDISLAVTMHQLPRRLCGRQACHWHAHWVGLLLVSSIKIFVWFISAVKLRFDPPWQDLWVLLETHYVRITQAV